VHLAPAGGSRRTAPAGGYAATGDLWTPPFTRRAQAMRAILFASATAATEEGPASEQACCPVWRVWLAPCAGERGILGYDPAVGVARAKCRDRAEDGGDGARFPCRRANAAHPALGACPVPRGRRSDGRQAAEEGRTRRRTGGLKPPRVQVTLTSASPRSLCDSLAGLGDAVDALGNAALTLPALSPVHVGSQPQ